MGIEIVREYVEQGVTGDASWSDRPAFQEMVSAILDNGVRTVIVENLTRLARAYVVQDAILVFLASKEVSLISAYTGEGVTAAFHGDPMKKVIIQMQAVFSALEKNSLVRKLTSSPPPACPPSQHRKTALPAASEVGHNRSTQGSLGHFPHAVHKLH